MINEGQVFYYTKGNTYWWARGKYDIVLYLIKKMCGLVIKPLDQNSRILDVGSGPGNMIDFMKDLGVVYGNDTSPDAVKFLEGKGIGVVYGDVSKEKISQPDSSFSLITMIDSLEHMQDDEVALKEVYRLLRPKGKLFITVPAYMFLWGAHDEKYGHYRRYTMQELRKKLLETGFDLKKISYFEPLFLLPLYVFRRVKLFQQSKKDDLVDIPKWLNYLLLRVLNLEKYYLLFFNFYFGATLIAVAEKP